MMTSLHESVGFPDYVCIEILCAILEIPQKYSVLYSSLLFFFTEIFIIFFIYYYFYYFKIWFLTFK